MKTLASSLDDLGLVLMENSAARPETMFLGASLARSQTFFVGVVALLKDNPLGAIILLRAYVEVLAATTYVRKNRLHLRTMFEPGNRPSLEKRIQVLVGEWNPQVRDLYRFLTDHFHFNHPHYQLQRIPGKRKDFILARVFGNEEQLVSGVLSTLAQITTRQINESRLLIK